MCFLNNLSFSEKLNSKYQWSTY